MDICCKFSTAFVFGFLGVAQAFGVLTLLKTGFFINGSWTEKEKILAQRLKRTLLLYRRLQRREATTKRLLPNTNSVNPVEPTCVTQDNPDVGCSSSISKTVVTACDVFTAPNVLQKGKIVAYAFRVFEKGSISGGSNQSHAPSFERLSTAGTCAEFKHFQTYIRTYNNLLAFTSLGVSYDKDLTKRNRSVYTFRVQGQMHHFIDDLYPAERGPRNLQLYFYDNNNEVANRMACSDKIDESIVRELMDILRVNPYLIFL
ncbi:uncharacterized protein LOC132628387 [Lycium barbarum]|uniref:uncharacterized protein LOC132628387 n=1 Tax=Lycium barbarum TaxID=112863 RepID=UPI00293E5567|nr:uncharacterized protein LOC132628387 [Lycium barbarum]